MTSGDPSELSAAGWPTVIAEAPASTDRPRRTGRLVALVTLIVLGLGAIAGGGIALRHELTRAATRAEVAAALAAEIGSRLGAPSSRDDLPGHGFVSGPGR